VYYSAGSLITLIQYDRFSGSRDLEASLISGDGGTGGRVGDQNDFNVVSPMHLHTQPVAPKGKEDTHKSDFNPPAKGNGTVLPKNAPPPPPTAPVPVVEILPTFEIDENYDDDDDEIEGEGDETEASGSINSTFSPLILAASVTSQSQQNNTLAPGYAPPPIPSIPHSN
jgi:hypothetical protein